MMYLHFGFSTYLITCTHHRITPLENQRLAGFAFTSCALQKKASKASQILPRSAAGNKSMSSNVYGPTPRTLFAFAHEYFNDNESASSYQYCETVVPSNVLNQEACMFSSFPEADMFTRRLIMMSSNCISLPAASLQLTPLKGFD
jgi:hypothetical protein